MKPTQFNKRWHSPVNVYMHVQKLTEKIGSDALEKRPHHKRAREARIAGIMAFVLTRIRKLPTVLRLPLHDPPDAYLMQPNSGTMDITTVEITSYRPSKESMLEQLIRTKLHASLSSEYILLVELLTEDKVDYQEVNDYAVKNNVPFPIWSLRKIQQSPDTIAEIVIMNPEVSKFTVNVGEEAHYFSEKYKIPHVVFTKKVSKPEDVREESNLEECNIAPWESLED
jgi:hypothetical protein